MSVIWATYYAYYVELTSCFVIACLPASRHFIGKKLWPSVKSHLGSYSISMWSLNPRLSKSRSRVDFFALGADTRIISSPLDGSFQHLTSHLRAEEPKEKQMHVGWAF